MTSTGDLRLLDLLDRRAHRLRFGGRPAGDAALDRRRIGLLVGDVLGEFEVGRARLLLLGEAEGLADPARDIVGAGELVGIFGDRLHHRDDVENLEAALLRFLDRLLAGHHQDRHAAELGISGGGDEVGRARPERRQADAGLAGVAAVGRRHEAGALLVAGQDQPDLLRPAQRIEHVEIFLAGNAENIFDALFLEALDEQV